MHGQTRGAGRDRNLESPVAVPEGITCRKGIGAKPTKGTLPPGYTTSGCGHGQTKGTLSEWYSYRANKGAPATRVYNDWKRARPAASCHASHALLVAKESITLQNRHAALPPLPTIPALQGLFRRSAARRFCYEYNFLNSVGLTPVIFLKVWVKCLISV